MDYKEEQAGEIEALKSIYEGDLEGNNQFSFSLKLYIHLYEFFCVTIGFWFIYVFLFVK